MLTLRATTPDDLRHLAGWETEPDTSTWLGETGADWHARALTDLDQEHLVAADGDALVGFAVLAGLRGGEGIELRRMVVAPAHRGAGRGRALLEAVLARAYRDHGAGTVWLDVKEHNRRARRLYESSGFVVREMRTNAIANPDGTAADLVIMVHQLGREPAAPS
ncbi:GNAT family N-acetyltransferase [Pseudonocardia acaciae]|uniref:GNAT family N-acetyltransferase n=1 Tax=Pseudonocardia acaciae TaxID=551276 RepID=UPI0006862A9B|nr:GNAT family N-acetyltransferase [Pseudonocardia acaciae]